MTDSPETRAIVALPPGVHILRPDGQHTPAFLIDTPDRGDDGVTFAMTGWGSWVELGDSARLAYPEDRG
jgi:hypothetical protein